MYNIALICEFGASTSFCVRQIAKAAIEEKIDCDIRAYSLWKLEGIVDKVDCILLGPQLAFKFDKLKQTHYKQAAKMAVINSEDFKTMNGSKILREAMAIIEKTS